MARIASLEEELRLAKKHRFGSHQQRGVRKSDKDENEPTSHEEAKGGFDGTEA